VASGVVGVFKTIWPESWGPRLEYILYAAVAALLECENVTLLGVQRMLSDVRYRAWVVKQIKDPMVRSFWVNEFENYDKRFLNEAIAPIQNKVGQLLMSPHVRNILGHRDAKVLEQAFGETWRASQFTGLGNHEVCAKLLADGQDCEPFLGKTMSPLGERHGRRERIVRRSREKYATKREMAEGKIKRWLHHKY